MHAQIFSRGLDQADHTRTQWSVAANSSDECTQSQKPALDHDDKERGGQNVISVYNDWLWLNIQAFHL